LDEKTGVCPKCFGGLDAPEQEEQVSELTSAEKVDLGDGPFATAPSVTIPTLTLDPFGQTSNENAGQGIQLELAGSQNASQVISSQVSPTLEMPTPIDVTTDVPEKKENTAQKQAETVARPQTRFEEMKAKMQMEQQTQPPMQNVQASQAQPFMQNAQASQSQPFMQNAQASQSQPPMQNVQASQAQPFMQNAQVSQSQPPMPASQTAYPGGIPMPMKAPTYDRKHSHGMPFGTQQTQQQTTPHDYPNSGYGQQQTSPYGAQYSPMDNYAGYESYHSPQTEQESTNYANPAYIDQEVTIDPQYTQSVDPRFSQTVNMNMQYNRAQVPIAYPQQSQAEVLNKVKSKNRTTAALLAIFLGSLGGHKFYLENSSAVVYLIITLCTCGAGGTIIGIISIIEGIGYLGMTDEEFQQKLYEEYMARNK